MRDGDLVRFGPCGNKKDGADQKLVELLLSLSENVTLITLKHWSENAKVRDNKGCVFFCNPDDLQSINK